MLSVIRRNFDENRRMVLSRFFFEDCIHYFSFSLIKFSSCDSLYTEMFLSLICHIFLFFAEFVLFLRWNCKNILQAS